MRIQEAYIENFGTLHQRHMAFDPTVTVLCQPNGTGKTTLTAFLLAMLYGLPAAKRGGDDDRTRYAPWQGGGYGGWIRLTADGCRMQIARRFGERPRQDTLQWTDLDTGRALPEPENGIGMALLGVDRATFLRCIRMTPEPESRSAAWGTQLRALLSGSDDPDGFVRAVDRLTHARRQLQPFRGNGGRMADLTQQLNTLTAQWHTAQSEAAEWDTQQAAYTDACQAVTQAAQQVDLAQKAHAEAQQVSGAVRLAQTQYAQARAAFGEIVPTEAEIDAAEQAWRAAQAERPLPDSAALRDAADDVAELERCSAALRACTVTPELRTRGHALERFFASGVPSEQLVARWQSKAEQLKKSEAAPWIWGAAGLIGLSVAAEIGCIWAPVNLQTALRWLGILPAAAAVLWGGIRMVTGFRKRKTAAVLRAELQPVCDRYTPGHPIPDGIAEIARHRAEWTEMRARLEAIRTARSVQLANQRAAQARLDTFFARYGRPDAPDDATALAILRDNVSNGAVPVWTALFRCIGWAADADPPESVLTQIRAARQRLTDAESAVASVPETDSAAASEALAAASDALQAARSYAAQQSRRLEQIQDARVRADLLAARRTQVMQQLRETAAQRDRVDQTIALLREAQDQLTGTYLNGLQERFLHYFRCFAPDEADVCFDESMQPQLMRAGLSRPMAQFSSGTQSVVQFCMRLAMIDLLFRDRPFLILDDPFVYMDDRHIAQAVERLRDLSQNTQILYFTCHQDRVPRWEPGA